MENPNCKNENIELKSLKIMQTKKFLKVKSSLSE